MKCPKCGKDGFNCYWSKQYPEKGYSYQYRKCLHCKYTARNIQPLPESPDFTTIYSSDCLEKAPHIV